MVGVLIIAAIIIGEAILDKAIVDNLVDIYSILATGVLRVRVLGIYTNRRFFKSPGIEETRL